MPKTLHLIITEDPDGGGYTAECAEMPGCITEADTLDNLYRNWAEASSLWLEAAREEKSEERKIMSLTYTYWQDPKDGLWVGYWNDYPDFLTQGHNLEELQFMLRDLRDGINVMVEKGEIPSALPCHSGVMELP